MYAVPGYCQVSSTILRPRPSTRATRVPPAVDPEEKPIAGESREKGRGLRSRGPITTVDQVEGQEGTAGLDVRNDGGRRAKGQAGGRIDGGKGKKEGQEEQEGGGKGEGREQVDKGSGKGESNEEPSGKASRASKAGVGSGNMHALLKAVEGAEGEGRRGRKRKDTTVRGHITDPLMVSSAQQPRPVIAPLKRGAMLRWHQLMPGYQLTHTGDAPCAQTKS